MVVSLTSTPEVGPSMEPSSEEKDAAPLSSVNTTSFLRYGPPSGVRVVSELARFSTSTSVRARCAAIPDALTERLEKRLTKPCLPLRWPCGWCRFQNEPGFRRD